MKERINKMAMLFDILSNKVRLCIILNLYEHDEKRVSDLQHCAEVSQSVVSQQLAKLKSLGVITYRKAGNEVYYSLKDGDIKEIIKKLKIK